MNTQRAFSGLAGSPLATITESCKKRGRPRKFASNADKMRAYRAAKKKQQAIKNIPSMATAMAMTQGHNLVTGGYGSKKLGEIDYRHYAEEAGRKVKPRGFGPTNYEPEDDDEPEHKESIYEFARKIRFSVNWRVSDYDKERVTWSILREYTESPESSTSTLYDTEYPLIPKTHLCAICHAGFDWPSQTHSHLMEKHGRDIRRAVREYLPQPTQTAVPKVKPELRNEWLDDVEFT